MGKFRDTINNLLTEKEYYTPDDGYVQSAKDLDEIITSAFTGGLNPLLAWNPLPWFGMPTEPNNEPDFNRRFKVLLDKIERNSNSPYIPIQEVKPVYGKNSFGINMIRWEKINKPILVSVADLVQLLKHEKNKPIRDYILKNNTTRSRDLPIPELQRRYERGRDDEYQELSDFCIEVAQHLPSFNEVDWFRDLKQKFEFGVITDSDSKNVERLKRIKRAYDSGHSWDWINQTLVKSKKLTKADVKWSEDDPKIAAEFGKLDKLLQNLKPITQKRKEYTRLKNFCHAAYYYLSTFFDSTELDWLKDLEQKLEDNAITDKDNENIERLKQIAKAYDDGYTWEDINKTFFENNQE